MQTAVKIAWLVACAALAGCAREPVDAIDAARGARAAAEAIDAQTYAPQAWILVRDTSSKLDMELQAQRENGLLERSYQRAEILASDAQEAAELAVAEAQAARLADREDALACLEKIEATRAELAVLLTHASIAGGMRETYGAEEAEATQSSIREAEAALATRRFADAKLKADAVLAALVRVRELLLGDLRPSQAKRRA